jgi:hypothetical protein
LTGFGLLDNLYFVSSAETATFYFYFDFGWARPDSLPLGSGAAVISGATASVAAGPPSFGILGLRAISMKISSPYSN